MARWTALGGWLQGIQAGKGAFDLEGGIDSKQGPQGLARLGYGLTSWLEAGAEAYAGMDGAGILAGLHGTF